MERKNLKSGDILTRVKIENRAFIIQVLRESDSLNFDTIILINKNSPGLTPSECQCLFVEYWQRNPIELEKIYATLLPDADDE